MLTFLFQRIKEEQFFHQLNTVCLFVCFFLRLICRGATEFNRLLGLSMEVLLRSCEHEDSDIRLVADACLNRLIKGLMDSSIHRVILELFREMRRV